MQVKPENKDSAFRKSADLVVKEFLQAPYRDEPVHLEAGIRQVVLFLVRCGFKTTSSCEGGEGHAFKLPTVVIKDDGDTTVDKIAGALVGGGYAGFTIQHNQYFQNDVVRWKFGGHNFAIEFWVTDKKETVDCPKCGYNMIDDGDGLSCDGAECGDGE